MTTLNGSSIAISTRLAIILQLIGVRTIPTLYRCIRVNYKDEEPTNIGGYTHYMLDFKVYKSKQKLLEVINNE